jgi:phage gp36-like protein
MATAYTKETDIEAANVGGTRLDVLLDREGDGTVDTGVLDAAIAEAGAIIDARLDQRYATPFAAITDTPDTPDIIQVIARHLVLAELYSFVEPENGRDAARHFKKADDLLSGLLDGRFDIPGATRQTAAKGRTPIVYDAGTPVFSGRTEDGGYRGRGF